MIYRANSDVETEAIGKKLAEMLTNLGKKRAYIAMRGEMGVGKTVFTRGFVSHFGRANVKSPTYTIVNEYRVGGVNIYHFDLYRISDGDDLESIGYHEYVESDAYSIVEWSERVPEYIPEDAITVTISRVAENEALRDIEIVGGAI
ncbi:MAG: tRNA (adenosine(37)-N6)-threonylcarbamoyltransferase complex ATPase subunit type 1 TsaE [Clostridia bacterium]|nr:tRNA (adenosine(37)-N6)-threonylcarbamoyltransferase complex ATPase subunit type 1 TsaE [Clostridia bacterium]